MVHKTVLKIVPGTMALAVAGRALKMVPRKIKMKRKPKRKKMTKGFVDIMVGTALIKPTADIVAGV